MRMRIYYCLLLLAAVVGCAEVKEKYQDTSELEQPPKMDIVEPSPVSGSDKVTPVEKKSLADSVFLDDAEKPTVLKIKKLFDRSWDIVGQAIVKKKIEITDKNREQGVFYLKYDASQDSGSTVFGNIRLFVFEDEYTEAEYKLTVTWWETATEVRAEMIVKDEDNDRETEYADGSAKLLKALYDTISNQLTE
jgi:uncharacterized lipoprotein